MRPHPSEPHTHREEGTSPMQRRKLPAAATAALWIFGVAVLLVWAAVVGVALFTWVFETAEPLTTCDLPAAHCGPVPRL